VSTCRAKLGAKCVKRKSISVKKCTCTVHVSGPRPVMKKRAREHLGGALYMNAMFSSLGFLLVGVEIAEFEFTDCISYTNPMCLQRE